MDLDTIIKSWECCTKGMICDPECPMCGGSIHGDCLNVLKINTIKTLKKFKALEEKRPVGSEQEPCLRELRALLQENLDRNGDAKLYVSTIIDWIDLKLNCYIDRDSEDIPKQSFKDQDIDRQNDILDKVKEMLDEHVEKYHKEVTLKCALNLEGLNERK